MMKSSKVVCLFVFLTLCSHLSIGGNGSSPNPTGGFGGANTNNSGTTSNNSTGGFGPTNPVPTALGSPPPPPPDPTPLDPGVIVLIVATLALGVKKLYNQTRLNDLPVK
jgi:hypothetical protein